MRDTLARRLRPTKSVTKGAGILAGGMMFAGEVDAQVLFSEDFEGLPLLDSFSESETLATAVWTDVAPAGWTRDNTTTPADGPAEFFGWTFLDKDWWLTTAGDQGRSEFAIGQGTVAVADGDEYDDLGDIDPNLMNVFLQTPNISTAGFAAGTLTLSFDSSFRPYPTMQGLVDVSFDGGATFENVLTLNDNTVPGGTSSLSRANENVVVNLDNPGDGGDIVVRYGYVEAGNDWWWAIDNVQVLQGDPALTVEVNRDTGELTLVNGTVGAIDLSGYSIESAGGALIESNWDPIAGRLDSSGDGSIDSDGAWTALTLPGQADNLSEASLDASDSVAGGTIVRGLEVDLSSEGAGAADGGWRRTPIEDVVFRYIVDGEIVNGLVTYTGEALTEGDFDGDGDVDADDWAITRDNQRADLSALSVAEAYQLGDLTGDLVNDHADFVAFKEIFVAANGAAAFAALFAVPEPTTFTLLAMSTAAAGLGRRRD